MRRIISKKSIAVGVLFVLAVVVCLFCSGVFSGKKDKSGQENASHTSSHKVSISWKDQPFVCYISGIEGTKVLQEKKKRYSDVNLLAAVNPLTHEILLVNTPRDTLLSVPDVPGADEDEVGEPEKLDAMPLYGKKASRKVLEELYGISIDAYVQVNYTVLKGVVDALGGVTVYSESDFSTDWGPSFQKGDNQVNGKEALAFARERHHLQDGDLQRGRNQQYLLRGIIDALKKPSNLPACYKVFRIVKKGVSTNISAKSMKKLLAWQVQDSENWDISNYTLQGEPSAGVTNSSDGQEIYAFLPDSASVKKAAKKINKVLSNTRGD
jgi:LCP family protein required for cell wall assembly